MTALEASRLRALRAKVYGECSDRNWDNVIANWAEKGSRAFLEKHSKVTLPDRTPKKNV